MLMYKQLFMNYMDQNNIKYVDRGENRVRVTYNGSVGASMNANFPKFMNGPQFAYYYNVAQMMDQLANGEI